MDEQQQSVIEYMVTMMIDTMRESGITQEQIDKFEELLDKKMAEV
jgi:predicted metal-dependent phosphotriesterase family hydrolase